MKEIVIGSRNSPLALVQSKLVISWLTEVAPQYEYSIKKIKTHGDKILDVPLAKIGDKGLFVKELESALLNRTIDIAVHSMKDVPTKLPSGLIIGAIAKREDPRDVLIPGPGLPGEKLESLPAGENVGTSSLRRIAQILHHRPDLRITPIRGNLNTRMKKLQEQQVSALVLAYAGIKRMGWLNYVSEIISADVCLPAVGQGALGLEIRADDKEIADLVCTINHQETNCCIAAERAFLKALEGGCQVPIGALGEIEAGQLRIRGIVGSLCGATMLRGERRGPVFKPEETGTALAEEFLLRGASSILKKARQEFDSNE